MICSTVPAMRNELRHLFAGGRFFKPSGCAALVSRPCHNEGPRFLEINGLEAQIRFTRPQLPASLGELRIHNLAVAGATVDLLLVRHEQDVGVNVLRRKGNMEILVAK